MVNLRSTVVILQAQRRELIEQLDAVDRAIAALTSAADTETAEGKTAKAAKEAPGDLVAQTVNTRVKPKRVLSDAHKEAIVAGRRKGRAAKEVAAGRAREMPEEGFVPAIAANSGSDAPRLVKRQK